MNSQEHDLGGLSDAEQVLLRQIVTLSPLMRAQEEAEAEMDAAFAHSLRDHLVRGEQQAPHPTFARRLREQLIGSQPVRRRLPLHRQWGVGVAGGLAALAVTLAVLIVTSYRPAGPAFRVPATSRADLLFNLPSSPASGAIIRSVRATISLIHPLPARPYRGHLDLVLRRFASGPSSVPAYRLARPTVDISRDGLALGIQSGARRITVDKSSWMVAEDGGRAQGPLHSLAVSLESGELIYHDRRNFVLPRSHRILGRDEAVSVARAWLARLGWPGYRMPLVSAGPAPGSPKVRQVVFAWSGVGRTTIEEATLQVTPDRSVVEAWVWPPVAQRATISALSLRDAWTHIRDGSSPLVVSRVPAGEKAGGRGVVEHVSVVEILLTQGRKGTYLVPVYRFSGHVRLRGNGPTHSWLGLAPGT